MISPPTAALALAYIGTTMAVTRTTTIGRYFRAAQNATEGNFDGLGSLLLLQALGGLTAIVAASVLRILLVMTIVASIFAIALRKKLAKG